MAGIVHRWLRWRLLSSAVGCFSRQHGVVQHRGGATSMHPLRSTPSGPCPLCIAPMSVEHLLLPGQPWPCTPLLCSCGGCMPGCMGCMVWQCHTHPADRNLTGCAAAAHSPCLTWKLGDTHTDVGARQNRSSVMAPFQATQVPCVAVLPGPLWDLPAVRWYHTVLYTPSR